MKWLITISKYHSCYLCQTSLEIMLLPILTYEIYEIQIFIISSIIQGSEHKDTKKNWGCSEGNQCGTLTRGSDSVFKFPKGKIETRLLIKKNTNRKLKLDTIQGSYHQSLVKLTVFFLLILYPPCKRYTVYRKEIKWTGYYLSYSKHKSFRVFYLITRNRVIKGLQVHTGKASYNLHTV